MAVVPSEALPLIVVLEKKKATTGMDWPHFSSFPHLTVILDPCEVRRTHLASRSRIFSASEEHSSKEHMELLRSIRSYNGTCTVSSKVSQAARVKTLCFDAVCLGIALASSSTM